MNSKPIIYQLLPRLFANTSGNCIPNGTIEQNGSGKMNSITSTVLRGIKELGVTHVWYTGIIEHAHNSDYTRFGIRRDNPHVVKGNAGSPYAIKDYYDVDPDLAESVPDRMEEFEMLVARTHDEGESDHRLCAQSCCTACMDPMSSLLALLILEPTMIKRSFSAITIISITYHGSSSLRMSIWAKAQALTWSFRPRRRAMTALPLSRAIATGTIP